MAGMLERRGRILEPAGRVGAGLTLSPSLARSGRVIRGFVIWPVRAETAATSGLARYTLSSGVPERPGKLRLNVRREAASEGGAWPMPIHGPQADSRMRAPDSMRSARAPVRAIIANT